MFCLYYVNYIVVFFSDFVVFFYSSVAAENSYYFIPESLLPGQPVSESLD